jgi:hypothetical protein
LNAGRACFLIGALAAIALAAVHLRTEQTRCAADLLKLESKWVALRRDWWELQVRAARLRAPARIHDRVANLQADLFLPASDKPPQRPVRLTSGRAQ